MTSAERQRLYRARQRDGQAVWSIPVDDVGMVEFLIGRELLPESKRDDRKAAESAAAIFLEYTIKTAANDDDA